MLDRPQEIGCGCDSVKQSLMPLDQAISLAQEFVDPVLETETLPLFQCCGRISAETVLAKESMPFFDNSAMDGFAVKAADCRDAQSLPISMTVAAGDPPSKLLSGTAARIFTGAPIPTGADAVVMIENADQTDHGVTFRHVPTVGDNIRYAGSDQVQGAELLRLGQKIAPRHVGLLAANGIQHCVVRRRIRVGVFSTGDELAADQLQPGQIHDANRPMLLSLAAQTGADVTDLGVLPDDLEKTTNAFEGLTDRFDLVLTSGAVSMGGRDHIRDALLAAGGEIKGWRVAIKPGKPIAFGRLGNTVITGLPGNPFAAFVGFHLFVVPQLNRLSGSGAATFAAFSGKAAFHWGRSPGRAEVFPVRVQGHDASGMPMLERLGAGVSATLFPLAEADGLACVPAETDSVVPGDRLQWQPFEKTEN